MFCVSVADILCKFSATMRESCDPTSGCARFDDCIIMVDEADERI